MQTAGLPTVRATEWTYLGLESLCTVRSHAQGVGGGGPQLEGDQFTVRFHVRPGGPWMHHGQWPHGALLLWSEWLTDGQTRLKTLPFRNSVAVFLVEFNWQFLIIYIINGMFQFDHFFQYQNAWIVLNRAVFARFSFLVLFSLIEMSDQINAGDINYTDHF